jgi:Putative cyclase
MPQPQPDGYPAYDSLPVRADAPAGSSWGVFGDGDQLGCLNFLTPERVIAAAALIRKGRVFRLDAAVNTSSDPLFGRERPRHEHRRWPGILSFDDVLHDYNTQEGSQWDGFAHVGLPDLDLFYNAVTADQIRPDPSGGLSVYHWRDRMVGRGVLVDLHRYYLAHGWTVDPLSSQQFSFDDMLAALAWQEVELEAGSILLVRTGFTEAYRNCPPDRRLALTRGPGSAARTACGLSSTRELWAWLWNSRIAAIASDAPAVEHMPWDRSDTGALHYQALACLGLPLGEQFELDDLARDCSADGAYEFFLVSAPMTLVGGVATPANTVAIK